MNSDFCVAVHALVYLNHKARVLTSEELADNICTNPARVRRVLAKLKKKNLVETKEGHVGGYRFVGQASQIRLSQVAQALELRFVDPGWRSGDSKMACLVASSMANVLDGVFEDLNLQCVVRFQEISIADLAQRIFG